MMNNFLKKLGIGSQEEVQEVEFPQEEMMGSPETMEMPEDITANNFAEYEAQPAVEPVEQAQIQKQGDPKISRYKQLLDDYRSNNRNLGMLQAGNQIAQAIASGYGGKIGDGSESVKMLQGMNEAPIKQLNDEDSSAMVDAGSDVSKMYREQAYALLKKIAPEKNYDGQLENMSAAQLMKLPGLKNALGGTSQLKYIASDRVDAQGNPLRFNRETGMFERADGSALKVGEYNSRDITKKNAYGLYEQQTNLINNAGSRPAALGTVTDASGKSVPKEAEYSDIFRNAPEQLKEFNKIRDQFNKDMRDSREVATSVTNLASKLKPGPNGDIDSGLLGGIQSQAAKMAGQKGVLTDQDLVKFAGAGGVKAKLDRIVDDTFFGEMSDADLKFFKRFAQLMGKSLNEDILNKSQLYVEQGRQIADLAVPGITTQNVAKILGVDKVAPAVQGKSSSGKPAPGSIITVKGKQYRVGEDGDSLTPINK